MADDAQTRRLATIVALDVAGYSARTEADEARTTAEVAALRKVIEAIAAKHGGRVFNTAGDGFMLEFGSSLAAVEAAAELATTCEPKVRVGVHLGDVVVQPNGDLLGHGVNVAARLMAKSDPGGALVSAMVRQTIRGPLAERLVSRGVMQLDKMAETLEAFSLVAVAAPVAPVATRAREPLLAVLPFENLSSDTEMQFFSDGVSEDILGRIQRGSKLKVIGRTSSFQYRGADKPKAAAELKATHVLDGSIRRGGNKVRIAAHLSEAATRTTLWSDKYDRGLEDIFAVQDEISEAIAAALDTAFFPVGTTAIDPVAYDLYLRARDYDPDPKSNAQNVATLERVVRMAPEFADGWSSLAFLLHGQSYNVPYSDRRPIQARIEAALARCLELDPDNAVATVVQWYLCDPFGAYLVQEKAAQRISEKGRGSAFALSILTYHLETVGRNREAADTARRAYDLDPRNAVVSSFHCQSIWRSGRFAKGIAAMETHAQTWPDDHHTAALRVAAYAHQGNWGEVDAMLDPQRLAKFPLREHSGVVGLVTLMRSPDPASRRLILEMIRTMASTASGLDPVALIWPAIFGFAEETFDILDNARLGPVGGPDDVIGLNAYRSHMMFSAAYPELRANPRFVKLCARLGLVEYWLTTQHWPDCAEITPYDFRAECEKYRDYPKDRFFQ
jgi:TolB-like protein